MLWRAPPSPRPLLRELNSVLFNGGRGNAEFANMPRKINVCISPSRDDFQHTQVQRAPPRSARVRTGCGCRGGVCVHMQGTDSCHAPCTHQPAFWPPPARPPAQINDLAYEAVRDPGTGAVRFNVLVGGYFSIKRNIMSVPLGVSVSEDHITPMTLAVLRVFRWGGGGGRLACAQHARLVRGADVPQPPLATSRPQGLWPARRPPEEPPHLVH